MMNCPGNFVAHLAAALLNHSMMEVVAADGAAIIVADNHIEDGWIVLGDSPGLGITFDEAQLRLATVGGVLERAGAAPGYTRRRLTKRSM